ncbi:MAG: BatA domain-containing protein [Verrucomicrobiota bacterium]
MSFLNFALLGGLAAVAIPVILHLLSKRTPRTREWGAMLFLLESVESRKRRIQLEEALLLATRCLLAGLLVLAVARPFVPAGSSVPWVIVLPAFLLAVVSFTTALVLRGSRKWFWMLMSSAVLLGAVSVASVVFERMWNLKRFATTGGRDIAVIIDGSDSMQLRGKGGGTVFEAAVAEAREIVDKAPAGSAFSLILGGPVPVDKIGEPVVNRLEAVAALKDLSPAGGPMAAFDAVASAALSLARGSNAAKEIIILTDGQNKGWEIDNKARWQSLIAGLDTLPSKPEVIFRQFSLPATFRNAAVAGIRYSREIIGVDRPVSIEVTVENTGTEAITPGTLNLTAGKEVLHGSSLGQLPPGSRQTVRFTHRFSKPGSVVLKAALTVEDDLAADNSAVSVCGVTERLGVLLVDGNPTGPFLQRAASFTALALAPVPAPAAAAPAAPAPDAAGADQLKPVSAAALLDPEVVPLTRMSTVASFSKYSVVVLADVPRLPDSTARRLAAWVQGGGGLLVLPGHQALPEFYNRWQDGNGQPLLPARLRSEMISKESIGVSLASFTHPAVALVADAKQSDLGGTLFTRCWKMEGSGAQGGFTGASLGNGDPFLMARRAGLGSVVMACANFDALGSNLPSRQAFVPLVHQLVYHLASPDGQPLNREPSRQLSLPLTAAMADGGLRGEYFKGRQLQNPVMMRIDGRLDINWGNGPPGPGVPADFSARWTGSITPRYSEEYTFEGWGDDSLSVRVGGQQMFERGGDGKITLQAGQPYPIRLDFSDRNGGAAFQLRWRSQSQNNEVIPAEVLTPFSAEAGLAEAVVGQWEVSAPDGGKRRADLMFTRGGLVARMNGGVTPGLYRLVVPKESAAAYAGLLAEDGNIPFSIARDVSESRLTPLSPAEMEWLRKQWSFVETASVEEVLAALSGKKFGEELWKYLAVGALFLLLAETALSRWIALSRQSGQAQEVDFESRGEPSAAFQEQLRRVRETAGA